MKKFLVSASAAFLVILALVSCATPPPPAPAPAPVAEPAPAPTPVVEAPPPKPKFRDEVTNEPLPVSIKTFYPTGDSSGSVVSTYNDKGYPLTQKTFNANGTLVETRAGAPKGDLWRVTVVNALSQEVLALEDRLYSPEGDLLTQSLLSPKEVPQSSNEYQWSEGKMRQWVVKLGATSTTQSKTVYTYDQNGNNTKTEVFDAGNKLLTVFESQYDAQGHILVRKGLDTEGNLVEQTNFTWNGDQKIKEETVKPLLRTLDYTYSDASTAPSGIASSVRGRLVEKQVREYIWIKRTHQVANKE